MGFLSSAYISQRAQSIMCLTTAQKVYNKFRNCDDNDSDFESEVDCIHPRDGSSFAIDDGRSYSITSDCSEITYGNSPSDTSPTTAFAIDNDRSFTNTPDLGEDTSVISFFDTSIITATDEQQDMMIESSEAIIEDHTSSMVAFIEMTRHKPSRDHSFPIQMIRDSDPMKTYQNAYIHHANVSLQTIDKSLSDELMDSILVRSDEVQKMDVLSGRGGKSNHHLGNKFFRHLITENRPAYRSSLTRTKKAMLSESIVKKVHDMGGRFLIQNNTSFEAQWRIMTIDEARRKTSQALRETRKLQWTHFGMQ
jgi:hypothetical protein